MKSKSKLYWILYLTFALLALFYVDGFVQPGYWIKSFFKVILFALFPLLGLWKQKKLPTRLFSADRNIRKVISLCFGLIILILLGYLLLQSFTTFENIPQILSEQVEVTLNNFLWVSLYIILINSFLEEFFFRYLFLNIFEDSNRNVQVFLSSISFSLYHVGILFGWFDLWLFLLMVLGLFLGGLFFIRLNSKPGSIMNSYLVHMSANIGINLVGFILLNTYR